MGVVWESGPSTELRESDRQKRRIYIDRYIYVCMYVCMERERDRLGMGFRVRAVHGARPNTNKDRKKEGEKKKRKKRKPPVTTTGKIEPERE